MISDKSPDGLPPIPEISTVRAPVVVGFPLQDDKAGT